MLRRLKLLCEAGLPERFQECAWAFYRLAPDAANGGLARGGRNMRAKLPVRGARYSSGFPACPNLEDQAQLLALVGADAVGIRLGDEV